MVSVQKDLHENFVFPHPLTYIWNEISFHQFLSFVVITIPVVIIIIIVIIIVVVAFSVLSFLPKVQICPPKRQCG